MKKRSLIYIFSGLFVALIVLIVFIVWNNNKVEYYSDPVERNKAFHDAVVLGEKGKALKLIEQGADVDYIPEKSKMSLIMYSIVKKNISLAEILIEKSKNIDAKDERGDTALMYVALSPSKNIDIGKLLIEKGADVNIVNYEGETPLMRAMVEECNEMVELLVEKGADVNAVDKRKDTPLMKAVRADNKELVKLFLEKGADINASNEDKTTALMMAVTNEKEELVKLLVEKGADVNYRTDRGVTALSLAKLLKNLNIMEYLGIRPENDLPKAPSSTDENQNEKKTTAWVCCQKLIKDNLKSPSTAEFPWWSGDYVTSLGGEKYKVEAYVDSQNSFGAIVRTNFSVTIILTENGFTYENLQMDSN